EFYAWLKIMPPPEKGDCFVNWRTFMMDHLKVHPDKEADKYEREFDKVTTRPWTAKDYPHIAAWLKLNEKPLALPIQASQRTHYSRPIIGGRKGGKSAGLLTASLAGVQECRGVANALSARAMLRVADKRPADAWQDLVACQGLGRLIGRGGTLIEGLVGI